VTQFKIETKSNGLVTGRFAVNSVSEINNNTRGDTASLELDFRTFQDLTVASGETYVVESGEVESWDNIIVDGTLTINGTLYGNSLTLNQGGTINDTDGTLNINTGSVTGYSTLLDYDEVAGAFTTNQTLGFRFPYSEQFASSKVDTLLVGIEPAETLQNRNISGVWGLIENVEDSRNSALSINRLTIDVTILAQYDEYTDHSAVETDLEV